MLIVADENIPLLDEFFGSLGSIKKVHGRHLSGTDLEDAEVLLVRSISQVNQALLAGSKVRFVASATIGTDHVDQVYLKQRDIGFANAPGCNADSVGDYVLSALYNLCALEGCRLTDKTIGIIGVGNVGRRLQQRLEALGCSLLCNDPPRQQAEVDLPGFVSRDELLDRCDVFCAHTPLVREGAYPSFHLLDAAALNRMKTGSWLINAGRGGVIDNRALLHHLQQQGSQSLRVVLDVWENEPSINAELARAVLWGTPHIAGYSLEGRMRGTEMIYQALCEYLDMEPQVTLDELLPVPAINSVSVNELDSKIALQMINLVYDLRGDHYNLQQTLNAPSVDRALSFDLLRRHYPPRRQFTSLAINNESMVMAGEQRCWLDELQNLGFNIQSPVN